MRIYPEYPADQPIPRFVVDTLISEAVGMAVSTYDAVTAKPRHEETNGKLSALKTQVETLESGQTEIKTVLNQIKGGLWVLTAIGSLIGIGATIMTLIHGVTK